MTLALIIFIATYVLMISLSKVRWLIAFGSAILYVLLGIMPLSEIPGAIDWNVLLMITGTMGTVALFIQSQMPALLADKIIDISPNEKWVTIALSVFAGIISAFVDNVATVLMVAPLALTIAKKIKSSPVMMVIAVSIASNLEGAATLVGDTTSILLGGYADMNFFDFFWYEGKPGLFFINQIGLLAATLILFWLLRKKTAKLSVKGETVVKDLIPSYTLGGTIISLILASFSDLSFLPEFVQKNVNGLICIFFMVLTIILEMLFNAESKPLQTVFDEIDYQTILLLGSLFVVIASIKQAGVIDAIADLFFKLAGDNLFLMYTIIVWASVLLSAFIDNIPYVATMLPVVTVLAGSMGQSPTVLYFGLLCGATLGGNLTPIGASANIAGIGILRKEGHEVQNRTFMKVSVPYTLAAVTSAYILVWILFA